MCFISICSVLNKLSEYIYSIFIPKNITPYALLVVLKIVESLQCILNQAGMSLEKYEDFLELPVRQSVSNTIKFNFPTSDMCIVWKTKPQCCQYQSQVFFVSNKSFPGSSLIQFRVKGNNKSKSASKRVV